MEPLPPDPYQALGVQKDATQAAIKTAYRKLALRCHPDKVKDKGDEFHSISKAYELIGEEDTRDRYEADVRLHQLKQEKVRRFGRSPETKSAGFDMRSSPKPDGSQFASRGAPRYEERRPNGYASARPSPYPQPSADDGDYFGPKASAKKFDYEPSGRKSSAQKAPPPTREEERKAAAKKEKAKPSQKEREDTKKQRAKTRGSDRRAKNASIASINSDDSDSDVPLPRTRNEENVRRDGFVRREKSRGEDDEYGYDRKRSADYARESSVKDYILRSKVDGAPNERGAGPPPYANGARRNTRSPSPRERSREDLNVPKFRNSQDRPEFVRRSSARPKDDGRSTPLASARSRPANQRRDSSRRSPSPSEERMPPKPKLYTANTEPSNIRIPQQESERNRGYSSQELYREETRAPPAFRRSESSPLKPSAGRRDDATPVRSSKLRNMETPKSNNINNKDSGYSTSSSSEQLPLPPRQQNRYSPEREEQPQHVRQNTRSPERDSRDRAQERRPPLDRERTSRAAPPTSRSASYAYNNRDSDPEPRQASSGRRPSLQREGSSRQTSQRDELPRRPTLNRGESHRGSSAQSPKVGLPRGQTMPSNIRTGWDDGPQRARSGTLFNEIPQSTSPIGAGYSDDSDFDDLRNHRRGSLTPNGGNRPSRRFMQNLDSGYGTGYGASPPPPGRRASEDVGKMASARAYMDESARPPGPPKRYATYAGVG